MGNKLTRFEFVGNPLLFWVLCMLGVTIPFALIYLIRTTVRIETEMDDPAGFVESYMERKA